MSIKVLCASGNQLINQFCPSKTQKATDVWLGIMDTQLQHHVIAF